MMTDLLLPNAVDRVEVTTLQDNYIEMTAMDNSAVVTRAISLRDGQIRNSILAEHGFSALVKTLSGGTERNLLFDFGFSETGAAANARMLGLDLSRVEAVVLSHGHGDHAGGMEAMAALIKPRGTAFILHPVALKSPRYLKLGEQLKFFFPRVTRETIEQLGFAVIEATAPRLTLSGDVLYLGEIERLSAFEKGFPIAFREENGQEQRDPIEDDTSVVMHLRGKGLVILSGCAHAGIVNTVQYARKVTGEQKVHVVMGGFHLSGPLFESIIAPTVEALKAIDPDYIIPTHCTGRKAIMEIEKAFPGKFLLNMSGTKLTFAA